MTSSDAIGGMAEFKPMMLLEIPMRSIETANNGITIPMLAPEAVIEAISATALRRVACLSEEDANLLESIVICALPVRSARHKTEAFLHLARLCRILAQTRTFSRELRTHGKSADVRGPVARAP